MSFSSPWSVGLITTSPFPQPAVPTPSQAQFFPQSQYIVLPTQFHPPYTEQWTASVQHQFPHDWQATLNYIGNHTVHNPTGTPLSPALYVSGNWGAGGTGCPGVVTTGPAGKPAGAAGTPCSTTANQTQRFALTVANPAQGNQYLGGGGGSIFVNDNSMANYNGMIATVQHRLSSTFSLLANYTLHQAIRSGTGATNRAYLNPAAFCGNSTAASPCSNPVASGTYGNISHNSFRSPPMYQFDAQVSRVFPIWERLSMQLRLEAFNLLNHPNFNAPSGATTGTLAGTSGQAAALSSSTFGQVSSTSNTARVFRGSIKLSF